jgi:hypothetical protein
MSWKHISGWVEVTEPSRPSGPVDPGWGVRPPTDPGYDRPAWGGRPDQGLPPEGGHIWGALIRWLQRPTIGGGPAKPPGLRPIAPLPPSPGHPGNRPPNGGLPPHPWLPGHWEPIDPGYGKPPLWGWIPSIDNGLPETPGTKPIEPDVPTTKPTPPGQGGAWVPTDPDFGQPIHPCPPTGGIPHPPIWAWVPDRPEIGQPLPPEGGAGQATITLYPTSGSAPAGGGSGSINVTITTPGTWQVAPLPEWVTATPTGPQTADTNVIYTAKQNTTGASRTAQIKVNNAVFTLSQSGS